MTHLIQTIFFSQDDKIKFQPLDKGNNNHNNDYTFENFSFIPLHPTDRLMFLTYYDYTTVPTTISRNCF